MRRPDATSTRATTLAALAAPVAPDAAARAFAGPRVGTLFAGRYEILGDARQGRHGNGLPRPRPRARRRGRRQGPPARGVRRGRHASAQTLKQEIRLARKITHRNVVRTHDLGEADGLRFLTMEYVPGTTLRDILDRKGAARARAGPPDREAALPRPRGRPRGRHHPPRHQAAEHHGPPERRREAHGLRHRAHGRGRDDPRRDGDQTVGTPYYMSPEQARGGARTRGATSTRSASSSTRCSRGRGPSRGATPGEVMRRHVSFEPKPVTVLRPDLPELLERVLVACLAKSPAQRPPTANDLYGALQRIAGLRTRDMAKGILKDRLLSGEVVHGVLSPNIEPDLVQTLGLLGFDLYILDAEHGTAGPVEAAAVVRACEGAGLAPLVRPRGPDAKLILQYPRRRNDGNHAARRRGAPATCERLVEAMKYPPDGLRGLAAMRANGFPPRCREAGGLGRALEPRDARPAADRDARGAGTGRGAGGRARHRRLHRGPPRPRARARLPGRAGSPRDRGGDRPRRRPSRRSADSSSAPSRRRARARKTSRRAASRSSSTP